MCPAGRQKGKSSICMYTFDSRIRFSEVDVNRKLSTEGLIDYFQDCSTFQSEDLGVGFGYLVPRRLAWIINYWEIEIDRMPALAERVRIGTSPYLMRGFMGQRNFWMETPGGERLAAANSVWTLLNIDTQYPERVPDEVRDKYVTSPKIEMTYSPRKVKIPEGIAPHYGESIHVMPFHLDTNGHMNNAQYVHIATDCLPEGSALSRLRVEYKKQAKLGDLITPMIFREEDKIYTIAMTGEEDKIYAVAQVFLR